MRSSRLYSSEIQKYTAFFPITPDDKNTERMSFMAVERRAIIPDCIIDVEGKSTEAFDSYTSLCSCVLFKTDTF